MAKVEDFYAFKIGSMWRHFRTESFSFWMICCYLFFEYFRPQTIYPAIDILPWAQLTIIGAFIGVFFDRSVKWVSSKVNILMILFATVILLSSLNAYYPEISQEHYIDFFGWFVIYFLIINVVNSKERFYLFLLIFLLCSAKIAIGTSYNWFERGFSFTRWGLMGPRGYFQNSGELSMLMLTLFPVAYYLYQELKKYSIRWWEKSLLIAFWVTPILTIVGASSRGSQIALLVMMALMFRRKIFKPKSLAGIVILVAAVFYLLPEEQKIRFTEIGEDRTSQQRILYLKNGWEMLKEHPYLGVGYFNFPQYYSVHYPEDIITISGSAELAHNIFIQVGTDTGFTGLIIFLMLIISGLIIAFRPRNKYSEESDVFSSIRMAWGYGLIGYLIAGLFVTIAYYPFLWIGLSFLVAINNIGQLKDKVSEPQKKADSLGSNSILN